MDELLTAIDRSLETLRGLTSSPIPAMGRGRHCRMGADPGPSVAVGGLGDSWVE